MLDAINVWVRGQIMIHGLLTVDRGTFLATFKSSSQAGDIQHSYVLADTAGVSRLATTARSSQLLQIVGDTAFALVVDANGNVNLETRSGRLTR